MTLQAKRGSSIRSMVSQVLPLGMPLAIGYIAQLSISFTDAALVSRLGSAELAGVTLALSVFSVVMLFGLGIVTAVAPNLASSYRAKNFKELRAWYAQGSWIALAVSVAGIVILLNTQNLLELIGQDPALASIAQDYNAGAALGLPFFLLYVNARCLMTGVSQPRPATWIMLAAVPANFVLGYFMIFGLGPMSGMGVFGAGLASSVVRLLITVLVLVVLYRARTFNALELRLAPLAPQRSGILDLVRVGSGIGVRILLGEGFLPVLAFFVTGYGVHATAAHAVGLRVETLVVVFALGFSSAATTVAAWAREDGDWRGLRNLRSALMLISVGYAAVLGVILYASFKPVVGTVFGIHDLGTEDTLRSLLPLVIIYLFIDTLVTMSMGYLVGLRDTWWPTVVVAVSYWGIGLGTGVALAKFTSLGFFGLWIGMIIGAWVIGIFAFARAGHFIKILRTREGEAR